MQQSNVIEVVHGRDCDGHYYWTVKTDETHDCSISYQAGYERPRYPVPALRDEWTFYPDATIHCRWQGPYPNRSNHMDICKAYLPDGTIIDD